MSEKLWYDAFENLSVWCKAFQLTIEDVQERVLHGDWSPEYWNEMQYWCVLFYGQPIFEPYPEDQPSLLW